jgi:hypothetical protein
MHATRLLSASIAVALLSLLAGRCTPPTRASRTIGASVTQAAPPASTPSFVVAGMSRNPPADLTITCYAADLARITKPVAEVVRVRASATEPASRPSVVTLEETSFAGREGRTQYRYQGALRPVDSNARYRFRCGGSKVWSQWDEYTTPHAKVRR